MTESAARRGPGRPRKTAETPKDESESGEVREDQELDPVEVDLNTTPEAAAAHAAHGTTAHIVAADPDEDADDDVPVDRKDMVFHEDATRVGFEDGSQYEVKDGKITKRVKKADR